ncbi:MAG: MFS transporter [Actinomycetota bacterium]|nr:MFS transporter [Actinomycetota bacterium]
MRRFLALVSSIIFVDAMLYTALTPLVPGYADEFDLSKTGAGLLVAAFGAGALFGGIPGGLAAARFGPKSAVVWGLVLLGVASLAFAIADGVVALGIARFVQGFSSTVTWAGALSWVAGVAPKEKRGEMIGFAFGAAIAGAILGPMFGGLAESLGIRVSLTTLAIVAFAFAALAHLGRSVPGERVTADGLRRAFRDVRFLGGLWLNTLPAMLFGILVVLAPLALDDAGWSTLGIAAVFFVAGLTEVVINPFIGRATDRLGRLLPIRFALAGSVAVAVVLAASSQPILIAILIGAAGISFGSLYTPGMALTSHRAETAGLAQGLGFGIMNTAWAVGALTGPSLGGALAEFQGDSAPYLLGASLCALTLAATYRVATTRVTPREA